MICPKECGVGEERRSRPSRVALNHATKDLNSTILNIWICTRAYDAATHPYPTGASAFVLSVTTTNINQPKKRK